MISEFIPKLIIPELLAELITVLALLVFSSWLNHLAAKKLEIDQTGERKRPNIQTFFLRLIGSVIFPSLMILGLFIAKSILSPFFTPFGLVEALIPFLGFLILYQVLSVSLGHLVPMRPFTAFLVQGSLAVTMIFIALRFMGWLNSAMGVINRPIIELGDISISVAMILKALLLILILFLGAGQITSFVQNRVLTRTDLDPSLSFAMMRFMKFFLFGIGVLVVLDTVGVDLSTLAIFGGALGIGLGFGLQNITSNLVSGMILLLDRSIKQGDVITVGESYGWVVKLGARYIVVRTREGVEKLIPNANLIATEITNWSHSDRAVRLKIKVGVSYGSDPFKVRELLLTIADTNPRVLKFPKPNVLFVDFGESSLDFELRIWINDPQEGVESVRSALRFEIWKTFRENAIEIPFPQRDLHIRDIPQDKTLSLEGRKKLLSEDHIPQDNQHSQKESASAGKKKKEDK